MYTVVAGAISSPTDLNQIINTLQRAPGQTESGSYYLGGWSNANSDLISLWMPSISRGAVPASVSIDTSLQTPFQMNTPGTSNLDSNGFQIWSFSNASGTNIHAAGHWTIQY